MPIEARSGQVRPFGLPNFQQLEPIGTGTAGLGNGERRGQLGNPGNQTNPFVQRLIGEIGESERLPGDEQAKIERINAVFQTLWKLNDLADLASYEGNNTLSSELEAYRENVDDIRYVYTAFGLLASRSLHNLNKVRLVGTLRLFETNEDSNTLSNFAGSFSLTPRQNEIVGQLTTLLCIPYDHEKTKFTFKAIDNFPRGYNIISTVEAPTVVEGK